MTSEQKVLDHLAEGGEYYDSIHDVPDDILVSKVRAQELVMGSPEKFPLANIPKIEEINQFYVDVVTSRLIGMGAEVIEDAS